MVKNNLTKKQKEFFNYLIKFKSDHGVYPTYMNIQDALGYKSPNSVTQNLDALEKKGYLNRYDGQIKLKNEYTFFSTVEQISFLNSLDDPSRFIQTAIKQKQHEETHE